MKRYAFPAVVIGALCLGVLPMVLALSGCCGDGCCRRHHPHYHAAPERAHRHGLMHRIFRGRACPACNPKLGDGVILDPKI